jgi:hypothetical protein
VAEGLYAAWCRWVDEGGGHWELCGPDSEWRRLGDALAVWESEGWVLVKQKAVGNILACLAMQAPITARSLYMFERPPDPAGSPAPERLDKP